MEWNKDEKKDTTWTIKVHGKHKAEQAEDPYGDVTLPVVIPI